MTKQKLPMTFAEAAAQAGTPPTLKHLQANFAEIAAEAEAEVGPQVPALLQAAGRARRAKPSSIPKGSSPSRLAGSSLGNHPCCP